jgi:hypothetical protein
MPDNLVGIIGTDNIVPVYDPNGRWTIWEKSEVWSGDLGQNRYVPKIRDWVIDADQYVVWIVTALDPITLVPTLKEIKPSGVSYVISTMDKLLGGDVKSTDTYRAYLDTSVIPHTLDIDKRCRVYGSTVSSFKIFRGNDLSDNGNVISQKYDAQGNFAGNTIELELVAFNSHDNYAVRAPRTCNCMVQMPDGETVTAVFYDDVGHVVARQQLLVVNTSFVRPAYAEEKYITHVTLESNFLSPAVDNVLRFPLNVPLSGLNLFGRVHYSDGSTMDLPIDGSKFSIIGLDQYVSTIVGQKVEIVLSYRLTPGEATYNAVTGDGKFITAGYSLVSVEANNSYTVKLFGYPEWIDQYQGYRMRWFMLNLDRNMMQDVTPFVRWVENTGPFDPLGYGVIQRRAVSITLSDISGAYLGYIHTQVLDIVLRGEPQAYETPWEIAQEVVANRGLYGQGLRIDRDFNNKSQFTIHSNIVDPEEWLQKVYYRTYPLVNPEREINPVVPTHFDIIYGSYTLRYNIDKWNDVLNIGTEIPVNKTVYIRFVKETASGDIILSLAAIPVKS